LLLSKRADDGWHELRGCAEQLLGPSKKLASELSASYDQLRRYTNELLTFTCSRTDPESGVHTRRALEEHLDLLFSVPTKPQGRLSLALFSVAAGGAKEIESERFNDFIRLTSECAREADFVARYSTDEIAVVMPQTSLAGATILGDRLMRTADERLEIAVWGGVVEKAGADSMHSLLSRADTALYSARTHNEPCLFQHTGDTARRCYVTSRATAPAHSDQQAREKTHPEDSVQSVTSDVDHEPAEFLEV
jgi:GGDEF domain-containing protein